MNRKVGKRGKNNSSAPLFPLSPTFLFNRFGPQRTRSDTRRVFKPCHCESGVAATKQSSWIATARSARLAMTNGV